MLHCAQAGQREGDRVQREGGGHQEGHRESNALTGPRMTCQFHCTYSAPDADVLSVIPSHSAPDDVSVSFPVSVNPPHPTPDDVSVSSPSSDSG
jgi:hypothetical protein